MNSGASLVVRNGHTTTDRVGGAVLRQKRYGRVITPEKRAGDLKVITVSRMAHENQHRVTSALSATKQAVSCGHLLIVWDGIALHLRAMHLTVLPYILVAAGCNQHIANALVRKAGRSQKNGSTAS